jgi:CheY-like chemotaxis protein
MYAHMWWRRSGGLGYDVLEAGCGEDALRLVDEYKTIGLLLTDVVMPGLNGRKLAEEAKRRRPSLKVLFMTGYSRNAIVHQGRLDSGVELIQKPLVSEQLATTVRRILDAVLRASRRYGGRVMTQPPSPLTMLLSRHTRRRETEGLQ